MASSLTIVVRRAAGNRYYREGTGNLGTYAAGGVAVTKAQCELAASLKDLRVDPAGGIVFSPITMTDTGCTVKAYRQKDPAASGGADISLPEVADGTDISTAVFRFVASGH